MNVLFVSLGCDKNRVDSEIMMHTLAEHSHKLVDELSEADVVVVNTCCFIDDAKEESINEILLYAEERLNGNLKALIACGCLAQRYADDIRREIPEVDEIVGSSAIDKIAEAIDNALQGNKRNYLDDINKRPAGFRKRIVSTVGYYSYLKIAEGCNKNCSYCIIPKVRGKYRSIPMEDLIKEAEFLADSGVTELIIVAQETTLYGVDIYGKKVLPQLLDKISEIDGIKWIRLLYCYPEEITDELISTIKNNDKILKYLDIPIQSGCDHILRKMGRRTSKKELVLLMKKLRDEIPEICIRTTFITGFPGETTNDANETFKFISDMEFDRLGVFCYSREEGTRAGMMEDQVSDRAKKIRRSRIMKKQSEISLNKNKALIGKTLQAVIEGYIPEEDIYIGRTYRDTPDVDGYVFVNGIDFSPISGTYIDVKITDASEYDLIGDYTG